MRYAIISDIHANSEALVTVQRALSRLYVDKIICLGDIVGYNADPDFCVKRVCNFADFVIRGNHDKAVAGLVNFNNFNYSAGSAVRWTQENMQFSTLQNLKSLKAGPEVIDSFFLACHGAPEDEDTYIINSQDALKSIYYVKKNFPEVRICFYGHTHIPALWNEQGRLLPLADSYTLEKGKLYLINPGSVGQPRDNDPRTSFCVFDTDRWTHEYYRIDYPISEAQAKIIRQGIAPALARRLALGL
ncbi:MAG: metallophosphoesterase family protein [Spirochaetales bacterium]|nr:metallophosphoesterase family protein [Spirochaetales bacterium]